MQSQKAEVFRKKEKICALALGAVVCVIACVGVSDFHAVGIYSGCGVWQRLAYPFFHAGLLHAVLNVWCFVCLMFIYDISLLRVLVGYACAVAFPLWLFPSSVPTVGLSGVVFFLFASISFEVVRRWYYQSWMVAYLAVGFLFPDTNGWLHLYCYVCGFVVALLNFPIRR